MSCCGPQNFCTPPQRVLQFAAPRAVVRRTALRRFAFEMLETAAKKQRLQQALGGGGEGEGGGGGGVGGVLLKKTYKPAVRKLLHNKPSAGRAPRVAVGPRAAPPQQP
jgi:hypothetical protein